MLIPWRVTESHGSIGNKNLPNAEPGTHGLSTLGKFPTHFFPTRNGSRHRNWVAEDQVPWQSWSVCAESYQQGPRFLAMINGTGGNQKMERDMKWGMKWIWYDVIHCFLRCPTANPFPLESFCQHDSAQFPPRKSLFCLLNSKRGDNWPCHTCHATWTW